MINIRQVRIWHSGTNAEVGDADAGIVKTTLGTIEQHECAEAWNQGIMTPRWSMRSVKRTEARCIDVRTGWAAMQGNACVVAWATQPADWVHLPYFVLRTYEGSTFDALQALKRLVRRAR